MASNDAAAAVFFGLILVVGLGTLIFSDFRARISLAVQQMLIWAVIFTGATAIFAYRDELAGRLLPGHAIARAGGVIELTRASDGHFYANIDVNGVSLPFVVDTGATQIVLRKEDARQIGIDPGALVYAGRAMTANGMVRTAQVELGELIFAKRRETGIGATISDGVLDRSLLGMSYLQRFSKIEIEGSTLRLIP